MPYVVITSSYNLFLYRAVDHGERAIKNDENSSEAHKVRASNNFMQFILKLSYKVWQLYHRLV